MRLLDSQGRAEVFLQRKNFCSTLRIASRRLVFFNKLSVQPPRNNANSNWNLKILLHRNCYKTKQFNNIFYFFKIRNSTRRFIFRPSLVSFSAIGCWLPKPLYFVRPVSILCLFKYSTTAFARFSDKDKL